MLSFELATLLDNVCALFEGVVHTPMLDSKYTTFYFEILPNHYLLVTNKYYSLTYNGNENQLLFWYGSRCLVNSTENFLRIKRLIQDVDYLMNQTHQSITNYEQFIEIKQGGLDIVKCQDYLGLALMIDRATQQDWGEDYNNGWVCYSDVIFFGPVVSIQTIETENNDYSYSVRFNGHYNYIYSHLDIGIVENSYSVSNLLHSYHFVHSLETFNTIDLSGGSKHNVNNFPNLLPVKGLDCGVTYTIMPFEPSSYVYANYDEKYMFTDMPYMKCPTSYLSKSTHFKYRNKNVNWFLTDQHKVYIIYANSNSLFYGLTPRGNNEFTLCYKLPVKILSIYSYNEIELSLKTDQWYKFYLTDQCSKFEFHDQVMPYLYNNSDQVIEYHCGICYEYDGTLDLIIGEIGDFYILQCLRPGPMRFKLIICKKEHHEKHSHSFPFKVYQALPNSQSTPEHCHYHVNCYEDQDASAKDIVWLQPGELLDTNSIEWDICYNLNYRSLWQQHMNPFFNRLNQNLEINTHEHNIPIVNVPSFNEFVAEEPFSDWSLNYNSDQELILPSSPNNFIRQKTCDPPELVGCPNFFEQIPFKPNEAVGPRSLGQKNLWDYPDKYRIDQWSNVHVPHKIYKKLEQFVLWMAEMIESSNENIIRVVVGPSLSNFDFNSHSDTLFLSFGPLHRNETANYKHFQLGTIIKDQFREYGTFRALCCCIPPIKKRIPVFFGNTHPGTLDEYVTWKNVPLPGNLGAYSPQVYGLFSKVTISGTFCLPLLPFVTGIYYTEAGYGSDEFVIQQLMNMIRYKTMAFIGKKRDITDNMLYHYSFIKIYMSSIYYTEDAWDNFYNVPKFAGFACNDLQSSHQFFLDLYPWPNRDNKINVFFPRSWLEEHTKKNGQPRIVTDIYDKVHNGLLTVDEVIQIYNQLNILNISQLSNKAWIKSPPLQHQGQVFDPKFNSIRFPKGRYYRFEETHRRNYKYKNYYFAAIDFKQLVNCPNVITFPDFFNDFLDSLKRLIRPGFYLSVASLPHNSKIPAIFDGVINFVPGHAFSINEIKPNHWQITVIIQTGRLRELAAWRILPSLVLEHSKILITNGRDYDVSLLNYKLSLFSRFSANTAIVSTSQDPNPCFLNSCILNSDMMHPHLKRFMYHFLNYADIYGFDEMFLQTIPSTHYMFCSQVESAQWLEEGVITEYPVEHTFIIDIQDKVKTVTTKYSFDAWLIKRQMFGIAFPYNRNQLIDMLKLENDTNHIAPPKPLGNPLKFCPILKVKKEQYNRYYRHNETIGRDPDWQFNLYHAKILWSELFEKEQIVNEEFISFCNQLENLLNKFDCNIISTASKDSSWPEQFDDAIILNFLPAHEFKVEVSSFVINIRVRLFSGHLRELAAWRLLPMFLNHKNRVIVLNGRQYEREYEQCMKFYENQPLFSVHTQLSPTYCRFTVGDPQLLLSNFNRFTYNLQRFGLIYGFDEMFLQTIPSYNIYRWRHDGNDNTWWSDGMLTIYPVKHNFRHIDDSNWHESDQQFEMFKYIRQFEGRPFPWTIENFEGYDNKIGLPTTGIPLEKVSLARRLGWQGSGSSSDLNVKKPFIRLLKNVNCVLLIILVSISDIILSVVSAIVLNPVIDNSLSLVSDIYNGVSIVPPIITNSSNGNQQGNIYYQQNVLNNQTTINNYPNLWESININIPSVDFLNSLTTISIPSIWPTIQHNSISLYINQIFPDWTLLVIGLMFCIFLITVLNKKFIIYKKKPKKWSFKSEGEVIHPYTVLDPLDETIDRSQYILVVTNGTRGDIIPIYYLSCLVASLGVKIAYLNLSELTSEQLRLVAEGKHGFQVPDYMKLQWAWKGGWRKVFAPFNNAKNCVNYTLGPSEYYITGFNIKQTILGFLTTRLLYTVYPELRIGNKKKDNYIPRSANGWSLIQEDRKELPIIPSKKRKYDFGYVCGSDTLLEDQIINRIQKDHPHLSLEFIKKTKITGTNHLLEFMDYRKVYCHGGAGTMDTIIAAGAIAINADNTLDRDYIRPLTPDDFEDKSPILWLVVLMWFSSSRVPLNWLLEALPLIIKIWGYRTFINVLYLILKLIVLPVNLVSYLNISILMVVSLKPIVSFAIPFSIVKYIHMILAEIWTFPIVMYLPGQSYYWFIPYLIYRLRFCIAQDISFMNDCWKERNSRFWLQFEYVNISKNIEFCGHLSIIDKDTANRYEGAFIGNFGLHKSFAFKKHKTDIWRERFCFEVPMLVDLQDLEDLLGSQGLYSLTFNCQTFLLKKLFKHTFLFNLPLFVACLIGFILTGLWEIGWNLGFCQCKESIPYLGLLDYSEKKTENLLRVHLSDHCENCGGVIRNINININDKDVFCNCNSQVISRVNPLVETDRYSELNNNLYRRFDTFEEYLDQFKGTIIMDIINDNCDEILPMSAFPDQTITESINGFYHKNYDGVKIYIDIRGSLLTGGDPNEHKTLRDILTIILHECAHHETKHHDMSFINKNLGLILLVRGQGIDAQYNLLGDISVTPTIDEEWSEPAKEFWRSELRNNKIDSKFTERVWRKFENPKMVLDWDEFLRELEKYNKVTNEELPDSRLLEEMFKIMYCYEKSPDLIMNQNLIKYVVDTKKKGSVSVQDAIGILNCSSKLKEYFTEQEFLEYMFHIDDEVHVQQGLQIDDLVFAAQVALYKFLKKNNKIKKNNIDQYISGDDLIKEYIESTGNKIDYLHSPKLYYILDQIHSFLKSIRTKIPIVDEAWKWIVQILLKGIGYFGNLLIILREIGSVIYNFSLVWWKTFVELNFQLIDIFFATEYRVRIKSVWAATNLVNILSLSKRRQLEEELAYSSPQPRTDFVNDFSQFVERLSIRNEDYDKLFVPQHRKVSFRDPLLSKYERDLIPNIDEINCHGDKDFDERVDDWVKNDMAQPGSDGVWQGFLNNNLIRQSIGRYSPNYDPYITSEQEHLNWEVARALAEKYPEAQKNAELTVPESIRYYFEAGHKLPYSSGLPFISSQYKKREALFRYGWDEKFIKDAYNNWKNGTYPNQFYHAFVKAQVVNLKKQLEGKHLRTVVAQDLASYYLDQIIQLEKCKRITWRTTGVGTGMILNQNMMKIFNDLRVIQGQGGHILEVDATRFDSVTRPQVYGALANLWWYSFEHKGIEFANKIRSVMVGKYNKISDGWVIGITEHSTKGVTIVLPSQNLVKRMLKSDPEKYFSIANPQYLTTGVNSTQKQIINIHLQSGGGKTTFMKTSSLSKYCQEIDDLVIPGNNYDGKNDPIMSQYRKEARSSGNWSKVNLRWQEYYKYRDPTKILLMHDPHQLSEEQLRASINIIVNQESYQTKSNSLTGRESLLKSMTEFPYIDDTLENVVSGVINIKQTNLEDTINLISDDQFQQYKDEYFATIKFSESTNKHYFKNRNLSHPFHCKFDYKVGDTKDATIFVEDDKKIITTLENYKNHIEYIKNAHVKNRGLGTGQSATSWDNTWYYRAAFIMGWCMYHDWKKTPKEFFNENELKNTGDDAIWVTLTGKGNFDKEKFYACMHHFGVNLKIDEFERLEEIQYLGNKVYRLDTKYHPELVRQYEDFVKVHQSHLKRSFPNKEILTPPKPPLLVYHDQSQTLLRQSAFRYYQSSVRTMKPNEDYDIDQYGRYVNFNEQFSKQWLQESIMRLQGHGLLTAWIPQMYERLANYYIEDVQKLARACRIKNLEINMVRSKNIHPETFNKLHSKYATKHIFREIEIIIPQNIRQEIKNDNRLNKPYHLRSKYSAFYSFLRSHKFPSYYRVLAIQMKLREEDKDKYSKFYDTFLSARTVFNDKPNEYLDWLTNITNNLPRKLLKMQPSLITLFPDNTFFTPNRWGECFIFFEHEQSLKKLDDFMALINQSPIAPICDGQAFWYNINNNPSYYNEKRSYNWYNHEGQLVLNIYKNCMMNYTLLYMAMYYFERFIIKVPYIGFLWRLLIFLIIDVTKFYSVLGLLSWHQTAKSSLVISSMIPRDPYQWVKRFIAYVNCLFPIHTFYLLRYDLILPFIGPVVEYLANLIRHNQQIKEFAQDQEKDLPVNPWIGACFADPSTTTQFESLYNDFSKHTVITSETATGKSTMSMSAFIYQSLQYPDHFKVLHKSGKNTAMHHILLLMPRKILVNNYDNIYMKPINEYSNKNVYKWKFQRLKRRVKVNTEANLFVATYGHILNRLNDPNFRELLQNTLIVFDEFHEQSPEMIKFIFQMKKWQIENKSLLLSATPTQLNIKDFDINHFHSPVKRRATIKIIVRSANTINNYMFLREFFPEECKPANLIMKEVTIKEVHETMEALAYQNIPSLEISKRTENAPIDPTKALVCTSIINAGITLPNRLALVDNGYDIKNIEGSLFYEPSSINTFTQICGRVARGIRNGVVITPPWAGTGRESVPYPGIEYLTDTDISDYYQLPCLHSLPINNYITVPGYEFIKLQNTSEFAELIIIYILLRCTNDYTTANKIYNDIIYKQSSELDHLLDLFESWSHSHRHVTIVPNGIDLASMITNGDIKVFWFFEPVRLDQIKLDKTFIDTLAVVTEPYLSVQAGNIIRSPESSSRQYVKPINLTIPKIKRCNEKLIDTWQSNRNELIRKITETTSWYINNDILLVTNLKCPWCIEPKTLVHYHDKDEELPINHKQILFMHAENEFLKYYPSPQKPAIEIVNSNSLLAKLNQNSEPKKTSRTIRATNGSSSGDSVLNPKVATTPHQSFVSDYDYYCDHCEEYVQFNSASCDGKHLHLSPQLDNFRFKLRPIYNTMIELNKRILKKEIPEDFWIVKKIFRRLNPPCSNPNTIKQSLDQYDLRIFKGTNDNLNLDWLQHLDIYLDSYKNAVKEINYQKNLKIFNKIPKKNSVEPHQMESGGYDNPKLMVKARNDSFQSLKKTELPEKVLKKCKKTITFLKVGTVPNRETGRNYKKNTVVSHQLKAGLNVNPILKVKVSNDNYESQSSISKNSKDQLLQNQMKADDYVSTFREGDLTIGQEFVTSIGAKIKSKFPKQKAYSVQQSSKISMSPPLSNEELPPHLGEDQLITLEQTRLSDKVTALKEFNHKIHYIQNQIKKLITLETHIIENSSTESSRKTKRRDLFRESLQTVKSTNLSYNMYAGSSIGFEFPYTRSYLNKRVIQPLQKFSSIDNGPVHFNDAHPRKLVRASLIKSKSCNTSASELNFKAGNSFEDVSNVNVYARHSIANRMCN